MALLECDEVFGFVVGGSSLPMSLPRFVGQLSYATLTILCAMSSFSAGVM